MQKLLVQERLWLTRSPGPRFTEHSHFNQLEFEFCHPEKYSKRSHLRQVRRDKYSEVIRTEATNGNA